jgi:hypothetical protein
MAEGTRVGLDVHSRKTVAGVLDATSPNPGYCEGDLPREKWSRHAGVRGREDLLPCRAVIRFTFVAR